MSARTSLLLCLAARFALVQAWGADVPSLLARITLEEKISLLRGARDPEDLGQAGYWPGVPRLGIRPLRFADGPTGIRVAAEATAMPAPIQLAATFDPERAFEYGQVLGREARALGIDVLLAPHVNLVRDPLFRRNHTTFGEDPLLAARLATRFIEGVQAQGVMAVVKHLAVYNGPDSVVVEPVPMRELYLRTFEDAVRAGVAGVMCAYNRVNGLPACEHAGLLNEVLRGEWNFQGFVVTDWGALSSPRGLLAGVDLEMPGREVAGRKGPWFAGPLEELLRKGEIPTQTIDRAVARLLGQLDRFGLLDEKPREKTSAGIDVAANARVAQQVAEQGAVLLKNDGGLLPFGERELRSLAVIGPTARQLATGYMTERAAGFASRLVSPLEALKKLLPRAAVRFAVGHDLSGAVLAPPSLTSTTQPVFPMDFTGERGLQPGEEVEWSGQLTVPYDGEYVFMVQSRVGGGGGGYGEITLDGEVVVRSRGFRGFGAAERPWSSLLPTLDGLDNARGRVKLKSGKHEIQIYAASTGRQPFEIRFAWSTPEMRERERREAVEAARGASAAVVFAWHETGQSLELPEEQDLLIEQIAAANRRTVVVVNAGGPVLMPWKDKVPAILLMWYPGQEGGWATARLLAGLAVPAGKLPVTFPARLEDTAAHAPGYPERWVPPAPPGATGVDPNPRPARFTEGLAAGYRWFDRQGIEPLFPFGHGLSYTTFQFSKLEVKGSGTDWEVSFTVRNTGLRRGSEVAQVYVGPPEGSSGRPPWSLAGFARVELAPGKSHVVRIRLDERTLHQWSEAERKWVAGTGRRPIFVGSSSRDVRLRGDIYVTTPDSR